MPDERDQIFYDLAKGCKVRLITGNFKYYPVNYFHRIFFYVWKFAIIENSYYNISIESGWQSGFTD